MTQALKKSNPFADWATVYRDDPVAFAQDMLGIELHDYQKAPLIAMAGGTRKIAVRSGHGTGKSTVAAIAAIWYMLTRYPVRVVMTAPTISQLEGALFGAIRNFVHELPPALQDLMEMQRDRIFLLSSPDDAWMAARTARAEAPEALAGIHAENVLLLVDEASGIPPAVFEHAVGSMSGHNAHTLMLSNPTRRSGFFYDIFNVPAAGEGWAKFHFSCVDSPLVSDDFVREVAGLYGEDSNAFRVRVLGDFPTEDVDALIGGELVEQAMNRDIEIDRLAPAVLGVDVARYGSDRTAICLRRAHVVEEIKSWDKLDLMETTGRIVAYISAMAPEHRPIEICVDVIGVGAGVADRLKEVVGDRGWSINVLPVNVAENAIDDERAHRLRDSLWLKAKDWLEERNCNLPRETDLRDDLTGPGYAFNSAGKIVVESKNELRRRGHKSPDIADAFCLTFAGHGARMASGIRGSWQQPLKRNIKGVM